MTETTITRSAEKSRYELTVDGDLAGYLEFHDVDGSRDLTSTRVFEEWGGRGFGTKLIQAAIADAESEKITVIPTCPMIAHYFAKRPELSPLLAK